MTSVSAISYFPFLSAYRSLIRRGVDNNKSTSTRGWRKREQTTTLPGIGSSVRVTSLSSAGYRYRTPELILVRLDDRRLSAAQCCTSDTSRTEICWLRVWRRYYPNRTPLLVNGYLVKPTPSQSNERLPSSGRIASVLNWRSDGTLPVLPVLHVLMRRKQGSPISSAA